MDLFSCSITLQVKENESFSTLIGSTASLGIIIFTTLSFITMIIDMLAR
jgi:hypothetical protein